MSVISRLPAWTRLIWLITDCHIFWGCQARFLAFLLGVKIVGVSQASTIVEFQALVPLPVKVPFCECSSTRSCHFGQVASSRSSWLDAHFIAGLQIWVPEKQSMVHTGIFFYIGFATDLLPLPASSWPQSENQNLEQPP